MSHKFQQLKKTEKQKKAVTAENSFSDFVIKYANVWLLLAVVIVYFKTFLLSGLTHLDDTIFIFDKEYFNKDFSNLTKTFSIGCFNEKDIYYRPLFLVTFILEYLVAGKSFTVYHLTNLILHCTNVLLLFAFLKKLNFAKVAAFSFTLLFAVHPVLTMAVAWIPGRNDMMLSVFMLSFFLFLFQFVKKKNFSSYLLQLLFLFLALFTKETAVFIPFAAVLVLFCTGKGKLLQKKYYLLAVGWMAALIIWYIKKTAVLPDNSKGVINEGLLQTIPERAPGLLQYFGKVFLPFNLGVFPSVGSTTYLYGFISIALVSVLIYLNKKRNYKMLLLGISWFILFILPFFFVPKNINDQLFEHRLYIPIIGVFILMNQSIIFSSKFPPNKFLYGSIILAIVFSFMTFSYISKFNDELTFWSNAVKNSPRSAYANKMYGIKLTENEKLQEAIPYIKTAYTLDSTERYTNLFLARLIYIPEDSFQLAKKALQNEVRLNPNFSDTYFELAHVSFLTNDFEGAKANLIKFLTFKPSDESSNNNLLKLYYDSKQYPEARQQIIRMEQMGLKVNSVIRATVDSALKK